MNAVGLGASIVLGLAFVVAGGSKLAAGPAWPAQAAGLRAPPIAVPILPWLELAIGAALIAQLASPVPAVAALLLLVAFTVLISMRLAAGEHPPCACFGAWSSSPIGAVHLVRNAGLIALAAVVIAA